MRDKNDDGVLVKVKSRTITLALDEDSDVDALLTKAVEKHARHHKQFDKDCKYVLLYHDMSMVKNLPQSNTPFVLSKYQKDLLIPYSKMYFWLCSQADFESSLSDESSDTDVEMIHVKGAAEREQCSPAHSSFTLSNTTNNNKTKDDVRQGTQLPSSEISAVHPPNVSIKCSSSSFDQQGSIENYLLSHQCPTCLAFFSRTEIEVHADVCAEKWLDPIGECGDFSDGYEETLTADELSSFESEPTELRQDVIEKIKNNVKRTSINRITIRRREAFQGYLDSKRKK